MHYNQMKAWLAAKGVPANCFSVRWLDADRRLYAFELHKPDTLPVMFLCNHKTGEIHYYQPVEKTELQP